MDFTVTQSHSHTHTQLGMDGIGRGDGVVVLGLENQNGWHKHISNISIQCMHAEMRSMWNNSNKQPTLATENQITWTKTKWIENPFSRNSLLNVPCHAKPIGNIQCYTGPSGWERERGGEREKGKRNYALSDCRCKVLLFVCSSGASVRAEGERMQFIEMFDGEKATTATATTKWTGRGGDR